MITTINEWRKMNEGAYYNDEDLKQIISAAEKAVGKKLMIPQRWYDVAKEMKEMGIIHANNLGILLRLYHLSFDGSWTTYEKKDPVMGKLGGGQLYHFFESMETIYLEADYFAYEIIKGIQNKVANDEAVDSAYEETKEYFNSFEIDTEHNRQFNSSIDAVSDWMDRNNIEHM